MLKGGAVCVLEEGAVGELERGVRGGADCEFEGRVRGVAVYVLDAGVSGEAMCVHWREV